MPVMRLAHGPRRGEDGRPGRSAPQRLNVPFVIATNGHQWTLHDNRNATTTPLPRPMVEFPTPTDLREAYEDVIGIDLTAPSARPCITPYKAGETARRYQDAVIRAVFEKLAMTFIAVNTAASLTPASSGLPSERQLRHP
jgi:hypothetical protein